MKGQLRRAATRGTVRPRWPVLLGGIGLGSAVSYLLDPSQGRARRARARQKALHAVRVGTRDARHLERHVSNRAHGLFARVRAALRSETPGDEVVKERVRSALGRVCSHASAIEVSVTDGKVALAGPVLDCEHDRIVSEIKRVRGVREIQDELQRHVHPGVVSGLQERR